MMRTVRHDVGVFQLWKAIFDSLRPYIPLTCTWFTTPSTRSQASTIKAKSLSAYKTREKFGNVEAVSVVPVSCLLASASIEDLLR